MRHLLELMPTHPRSREEAEGYLRVLSLLLFLITAAELIALPFVGTPGKIRTSLAIVAPQVPLALFAYINARRGYRYLAAHWQLLGILIVGAAAATLVLHRFGSTSAPQAGMYVVLILVATVYFAPGAGLVSLILSTIGYGGVIVAETTGVLAYAPIVPVKAGVLGVPNYAMQMFAAVTATNTGTFVLAWYIARQLRRRREEAEDANEKLRVLDEAKTRFLGIVSHDLRTPITSIKAYGEILGDEIADEHKHFSRVIVDEADRLHRLVTDLLDLDKMEAGKMEWNLVRQDIRPVLLNSVHVFRAAATDKAVMLEEVIAEDLPPLAVDADRLSQLIANLLSNAIKFTPAGGRVTLATHMAVNGGSRDVHIAVADTGPGIAPNDVERIFDRFAQTAAAQSAESGTGLGLAIAKEIALGHNGDLTVASAVGEGTTFTITLPVTS